MTKQEITLGSLVLVALATAAADALFLHGLFTPAVVFAVPVLLSVYVGLRPRYVAGLAALVLALQTTAYLAEGSGLPLLPASYILGLGYMSVLAVFLADRMHREQALRVQLGEVLSDVQRRVAEVETTMASMADAIIVYSPTGDIVQMNDAAETMFGRYSVESGPGPVDRYGLPQFSTGDGNAIPVEQLPLQRALRGETVRGVIAVVNPSGLSPIWTSNSAAPIYGPGGELLGVIGISTDITELHELQEKRDDLVRTVSHDLRNPLTPVIGQAELLKRALTRRGLDQEAAAANAILVNAKRLNRLIEDMVDSLRLESGAFDLRMQETDLCRLVTDLLDLVGTPEDRDRIVMNCIEPLPPIPVDRERLVRAILNLISNALKYSEGPSPVNVSVDRRDGEAIVSVEDHGPGIPAVDQERLFDRYFRTEVGQRAGGLGLGLYIVRQIAEAHGGRVWVESETGIGSTFRITVPIRPR